MKKWLFVPLAIWLIAAGVFPLLNLGFIYLGIVLGLLAILAGVLLLPAGRAYQGTQRVGLWLLGAYLILLGSLAFFEIPIPYFDKIIALLALVSGLLIAVEGGERRLTHSPRLLLLCLYLVVVGLLALFGIGFPYSDKVVAVLSLVAGAALLFAR